MTLRGFWAAVGRPDIVDALPRVRAATPVPRPAPDDVLAAALRGVGERTRLMVRLAAELGLRRGEIAAIHADDVGADLFGPTLRVQGKGDKVRELPITRSLEREIRLRAGGAWLFPGDAGGHLSPKWVGTLIARVMPGTWTAHTLRHRWATRAYGATGDLMAVSRLLGHASVATTQRYVATDRGRLRKVMESAAA